MRLEIDSFYKTAGFLGSLIALVFGAGVWATKMYVTVEQTRVDQNKSAARIVDSIDNQSKSITRLASTLADHEARLRVNEVRINSLSEKVDR